MLCPYCREPMELVDEEWLCWKGLHGRFTEEHVDACIRSIYLPTVMVAHDQVEIKVPLGASHLVPQLFAFADRNYNRIKGVWVVTNLMKYANIPCIKTAHAAYMKQMSFDDQGVVHEAPDSHQRHAATV